MKRCIAFLGLVLLVCVLLLPCTALAEGEVNADTGYDWSALATVAGATAFTLLVVQFIKAPLDKVWKIPTRALVYMIAFLTLLVAQIVMGGLTWSAVALAAVNAVIAASASMGAYEMTFAKQE